MGENMPLRSSEPAATSDQQSREQEPPGQTHSGGRSQQGGEPQLPGQLLQQPMQQLLAQLTGQAGVPALEPQAVAALQMALQGMHSSRAQVASPVGELPPPPPPSFPSSVL